MAPSPPPRSQLGLQQPARECAPVSGGACYRDGAPGPRLLPSPTPSLDLREGRGDRTGGSRVRLPCLCKSAGWCISGPVCVSLSLPGSAFYGSLIVGPQSFHLFNESTRPLSAFWPPLETCAPGYFCAPASASAFLAVPHTSAGRRLSAPLVSWAPCVSLSPRPRVSCECVCVSPEFGCWWVPGAPAWRRPVQTCTSAPPRRAPGPSPHLAVGLSGRRVRGRERHAAALPVARSPARWLCRSLALPLRSGSAGGGGVGCRSGGRGGSCILAVGEESEPALLVSRRAQLQPRGPARPLAARPGLLGWAQARPRAGGGASPPPPAPFPPRRPGAGRSAGAGRQGFPRPPPRVRGVPGGGSPPRPRGPDRPLSRPTRALWQPIFLVSSAPAAPGALLETASSLRVRCGRDGFRPRPGILPGRSHPTLSSTLVPGLLGPPVSPPLLAPPPQVTSFLFGACCCSPCSSTEYLAGPWARTGAVAPLCVGAMRILANKTRCVGVVEGGTCVWSEGKGWAQC